MIYYKLNLLDSPVLAWVGLTICNIAYPLNAYLTLRMFASDEMTVPIALGMMVFVLGEFTLALAWYSISLYIVSHTIFTIAERTTKWYHTKGCHNTTLAAMVRGWKKYREERKTKDENLEKSDK